VPPPDPNCVPSKLYGRTGELWKTDGRIVDPSYAGYHTGIDPIPDAPVAKRVTDFGAKPDDTGDDTQAFIDGIAMTDGVLLVPAGKYIISQRLDIKKSNVVLRGEGPGKTTLFFPKSLGSLYGGDWSFVGGLITVTGNDGGAQLATITANAARGATTLMVSATTGIKVGDWVRVVQADAGDYSLFKAMYGGMASGNTGQNAGDEVYHHHTRVTAVGAGSITLERPLPLEVDMRWKPQIRAVKPTVSEVGIEHLTMEMQGTKYPGHFNEEGYNGIYFVGAHDSWVRDVTILNADFGVHFNGSFFCTATGVVLDTNFDRGGLIGHHGFNSSHGQDNLFTHFDFRKKYVHDMSVDAYAMLTVFASGKGVDLNFDHHGRAPYATVWTNIDVGAATRPYASGGSGNRMPHTGAYTTVWNVFGAKPVGFPAGGFGPLMNFVGVTGTDGSVPDSYSVEPTSSDKLCQKDLYEAMVAARRAGKHP
jgi:hypothetical protein